MKDQKLHASRKLIMKRLLIADTRSPYEAVPKTRLGLMCARRAQSR